MAHSSSDATILAQLLSEPANSHLSIVADGMAAFVAPGDLISDLFNETSIDPQDSSMNHPPASAADSHYLSLNGVKPLLLTNNRASTGTVVADVGVFEHKQKQQQNALSGFFGVLDSGSSSSSSSSSAACDSVFLNTASSVVDPFLGPCFVDKSGSTAGDSNSLSSGFGVTDQGVPDELNGGGSSRLLFLPSSSDGKNTQTTNAASSTFGSTEELPWWSVSQCDKSSSFEDFVTGESLPVISSLSPPWTGPITSVPPSNHLSTSSHHQQSSNDSFNPLTSTLPSNNNNSNSMNNKSTMMMKMTLNKTQQDPNPTTAAMSIETRATTTSSIGTPPCPPLPDFSTGAASSHDNYLLACDSQLFDDDDDDVVDFVSSTNHHSCLSRDPQVPMTKDQKSLKTRADELELPVRAGDDGDADAKQGLNPVPNIAHPRSMHQGSSTAARSVRRSSRRSGSKNTLGSDMGVRKAKFGKNKSTHSKLLSSKKESKRSTLCSANIRDGAFVVESPTASDKPLHRSREHLGLATRTRSRSSGDSLLLPRGLGARSLASSTLRRSARKAVRLIEAATVQGKPLASCTHGRASNKPPSSPITEVAEWNPHSAVTSNAEKPDWDEHIPLVDACSVPSPTAPEVPTASSHSDSHLPSVSSPFASSASSARSHDNNDESDDESDDDDNNNNNTPNPSFHYNNDGRDSNAATPAGPFDLREFLDDSAAANGVARTVNNNNNNTSTPATTSTKVEETGSNDAASEDVHMTGGEDDSDESSEYNEPSGSAVRRSARPRRSSGATPSGKVVGKKALGGGVASGRISKRTSPEGSAKRSILAELREEQAALAAASEPSPEELSRMTKLERNRLSAQRSRARKNAYTMQLEQVVEDLEMRSKNLELELAASRQELKTTQAIVEDMRVMMRSQQQQQAQASTNLVSSLAANTSASDMNSLSPAASELLGALVKKYAQEQLDHTQ